MKEQEKGKILKRERTTFEYYTAHNQVPTENTVVNWLIEFHQSQQQPLDNDELKKEIKRVFNRGYFSGNSNELSKQVDKQANEEAERILNLFKSQQPDIKKECCEFFAYYFPIVGDDLKHIEKIYDEYKQRELNK